MSNFDPIDEALNISSDIVEVEKAPIKRENHKSMISKKIMNIQEQISIH